MIPSKYFTAPLLDEFGELARAAAATRLARSCYSTRVPRMPTLDRRRPISSRDLNPTSDRHRLVAEAVHDGDQLGGDAGL